MLHSVYCRLHCLPIIKVLGVISDSLFVILFVVSYLCWKQWNRTPWNLIWCTFTRSCEDFSFQFHYHFHWIHKWLYLCIKQLLVRFCKHTASKLNTLQRTVLGMLWVTLCKCYEYITFLILFNLWLVSIHCDCLLFHQWPYQNDSLFCSVYPMHLSVISHSKNIL